jgi:hypothetical protein
MQNILLFDMDGVLLTPLGYHRALQQAVNLLGRALGFSLPVLLSEDIAVFEANQVTNEWDSAAISLALLLEQAWPALPEEQVIAALQAGLFDPPPIQPALSRPDFQAFAAATGALVAPGAPPLACAARLVQARADGRPAALTGAMLTVLETAHQVERSITHRVIQEHVLGSRQFQAIYRLAPWFDTPSYLLEYDRSNLGPHSRQRLQEWAVQPGRAAAILTNRPSLWPDGSAGTPEAELGRQAVGLDSTPIMGQGSLAWLANQHGLAGQDLLKPSPVHALAAIRLALGESPSLALAAAYALGIESRPTSDWQVLDSAQVSIFEDTPVGLHSLLAASQVLAQHGVHLQYRLFGIAAHPVKAHALQQAGAAVYGSLEAALAEAIAPGALPGL